MPARSGANGSDRATRRCHLCVTLRTTSYYVGTPGRLGTVWRARCGAHKRAAAAVALAPATFDCSAATFDCCSTELARRAPRPRAPRRTAGPAVLTADARRFLSCRAERDPPLRRHSRERGIFSALAAVRPVRGGEDGRQVCANSSRALPSWRRRAAGLRAHAQPDRAGRECVHLLHLLHLLLPARLPTAARGC